MAKARLIPLKLDRCGAVPWGPDHARDNHPDRRARCRETLFELMRRASLANPGDREAADVPEEQLRADTTCVAELHGVAVGFDVVLPRPDGEAELDGLFVEPHLCRTYGVAELGACWWREPASWPGRWGSAACFFRFYRDADRWGSTRARHF